MSKKCNHTKEDEDLWIVGIVIGIFGISVGMGAIIAIWLIVKGIIKMFGE